MKFLRPKKHGKIHLVSIIFSIFTSSTYIHTYIHKYIHTYIHTYVRTYILHQYSDTSEFANRDDLASSKSDVNKLDLDNLKIIPTDLNKQSNVVENEVVKKTLFDKFW